MSRGRRNYNLEEYIALIAWKYDLDPKLLLDAFVEAWSNETSQCGSLKITCREVTQDSATFLITKEEKVVSQFPVKLEILRNPVYFKNSIQDILISKYEKRKIPQKLRKIDQKIGELRYRMKGINVKAKIIEITPRKLVHTRFGTQAYVSNVRIADETGSIRLSLWNQQIGKVHVGDEVELKTCNVARFRGELQSITKKQRKTGPNILFLLRIRIFIVAKVSLKRVS